jgi:hypothetical protein
MSPSALLPRPDQIAELTRGLDLPLAAIDDVYLHIIADGVAQAFRDISTSYPQTVATGNEDEITTLLQSRLNRMIEEDRIWRQLVASVVRSEESLSFDGSHLKKQPDLSIYLSARARRFPLVAEAKIIDTTRGENLYCSQGLRRFLNGEYGWGGREAFMIAYVRDKTTIASRLAPFLAQSAQATSYAVQDAPIALTSGTTCDAARSRHGRSFLYTHTAPPANDPGAIALWHLWVDASPAAAA